MERARWGAIRRSRGVAIAAAGAGGALFFLSALVTTAGPAGASLTGACTAAGTVVSSGTPTRTYNPKVIDKATVPRTGDVHWVVATGVSGDRAATGEVRVGFPPPVGKVVVGEWGKNGKKVGRPGNSGTYHYNLPALIEGIRVPVSGEHHEPGINCVGAVVVTVKGHSPLAWVSLALTVVTVMNMALIMRARPKFRA